MTSKMTAPGLRNLLPRIAIGAQKQHGVIATSYGHIIATVRFFLQPHTLAIQNDLHARGYCANQEGPFSSPMLPIDPALIWDNARQNLMAPSIHWRQKSRLADPEHVTSNPHTPSACRAHRCRRFAKALQDTCALYRNNKSLDGQLRVAKATENVHMTLNVPNVLRQCHHILSRLFCQVCFSDKHTHTLLALGNAYVVEAQPIL